VRAIEPGEYRVSVGGSQPNGDGSSVASETFAIVGTQPLPHKVTLQMSRLAREERVFSTHAALSAHASFQLP